MEAGVEYTSKKSIIGGRVARRADRQTDARDKEAAAIVSPHERATEGPTSIHSPDIGDTGQAGRSIREVNANNIFTSSIPDHKH